VGPSAAIQGALAPPRGRALGLMPVEASTAVQPADFTAEVIGKS